MPVDIQREAAKYYDTHVPPFDDVSFYRRIIQSSSAHILELGCGTGRVMAALAESCAYIHGIDISRPMVDICRQRLASAAIPADRAYAEVADITNFELQHKFDLITAPHRVIQNLETDAELDGMFQCVRSHLAPGGVCVLNVFKPKYERERFMEWCRTEGEVLDYEHESDGIRMTRHRALRKIDTEHLVLYSDLIYRTYENEAQTDEAVLKVTMRCYYPDEFVKLIIDHGFKITGRWGGYAQEPYGEGPELVVAFTDNDEQCSP
ncbi:class I SAM-dependent methyltransferase [bacterium]|nr:class I SAM-dependent methyltransferase [bacterium]